MNRAQAEIFGLLLSFVLLNWVPSTNAAYYVATVKPDPATMALQSVESITPENCNGGPNEFLDIMFDTTAWKAEANAAVRLSNVLSHWLTTGGIGLSVTDEMLFAMTRSAIEVEKLTFGSAIAFEPGIYRNMSKFCAYSYNTYNNTINSLDTSVEGNYFPSEWYNGCKLKFLKTLGSLHRSVPSAQSSEESLVDHNAPIFLNNNVTLRLSEVYNSSGVKVHKPAQYFIDMRMEYEDGFWTRPYFDCGGGYIWMITFNSAIVYVDRNGSLNFGGAATVDLALNILDINQCDPDNTTTKTLNVFQGTHHCRPNTTCIPRSGFGFKRGTYYCYCARGFYFPNQSAEVPAFSGFDVELAYASYITGNGSRSYVYISDFDCLPCADGCETCEDGTPCLAQLNWIFRSILLGLVIAGLIIIIIAMILTVRNRHRTAFKVASPTLLLLICFGGILVQISGFVDFLQLTITICTVRIWLLHLGFSFVYGPLLLKVWRVSLVEAVSSINVSERGPKGAPISWFRRRFSPIVLPVLIDLIVWSVVHKPTLQLAHTGTNLKYYLCHEDWMDYGTSLVEFFFLLWGVYLCFKRRNVASPNGEVKHIAWGIYITTFWKNFITIIRVFLSQSIDPDILYLLYILEWQVPVTVTLITVFLPKVYRTRRRRTNKINPATLMVEDEDLEDD